MLLRSVDPDKLASDRDLNCFHAALNFYCINFDHTVELTGNFQGNLYVQVNTITPEGLPNDEGRGQQFIVSSIASSE